MIPMESTILVVTMGSMAASSMVIVSTMVTPSSTMTMIVMRERFLKRGLRMMLVDSKPALPVFCLLHAIL